MAQILIIDDEAAIRSALREILEYEGHKVVDEPDGAAGVRTATRKRFDVIFCDIKMPRMDGMDVLELLKEKGVNARVIMISGHATVSTAVEALKKGAFDFVEKPLDLNRILATLKHATTVQELEQETKRLTTALHHQKQSPIIGESDEIRRIKDMITTVAPTDARVLITGSNGVGKELVARSIHDQSTRQDGPFVEVNCAAIPSELIESELFGHEKGAFTSAVKMRVGKFELAHGGTLFLDEIGDMSADAQAKVLRALQENRIQRVGGDKDIVVDVRVVAATNKNLRQEMDSGQFREDLYHRLAVIPIEVPDLNDRRTDIPLLVHHFLELICKKSNRNVTAIQPDALAFLQSTNWTGNIRELRNVVERLVIFTRPDDDISLDIVQQYSGMEAT
ncbi:MAG: sigma-54-dependent transcriptional regulator [Flavobacteriales bacterium]